MCLGVPGKIEECFEKDGLPMAKVNFGGITKDVCLSLTPEAEPGEYVIVHVGFSLNVVDEEEAGQIFESLQELEEAAAIERNEIDSQRGKQAS